MILLIIKQNVISAPNLLQPFISLTILWLWRLHIIWPSANLFDFIVCLTSLLKVHSVHPDLHLANAKHISTHILYLWSSSQRFAWLTYFNQVSTGVFFYLFIYIHYSWPSLYKISPVASLFSPSPCFLSFFHSIGHHWTCSIIYCLLSPTRKQAFWYQQLPFVAISQNLSLALDRR